MKILQKIVLITIMLLPCCFFALASNKSNPLANDNKKLRILVATDIFPVLPQRYVLNQIVGLIQDGHDVSIYAQRKVKADKVHQDVVTYNLMSKLYIQKLPRDIENYDIILCQHGEVGVSLLELKKKYNLQAKLVTFFRGYEIWGFADKHPEFYNELFKEGDFFLTNCEAFKKRAIELGCPKDKILVNYSSIDLEDIPYKERQPDFKNKIKILTTARLQHKKGVADALSAIALLAAKYPHIEYTIAGYGPLKRKLVKRTKKLGIKHLVTFFGGYKSEELRHILEDADIFIAPSVTPSFNDKDAFTNTLKEAMASGLPIISTYHGGIPEFIKHEENGLLVEEHDKEGLAQQIETLIKNPHLVNEFGKKGRILIENNFERSQLNQQLITYLNAITSGTISNYVPKETKKHTINYGQLFIKGCFGALLIKLWSS